MAGVPAEAKPDDVALAAYGEALAAAIDAVIEGWVLRSVEGLLVAARRALAPDALVAARADALEAARAARVEVGESLRALLALDIDEQRITPLMVLRRAVRHPTEVLRAAGVPLVARDAFDERAFPEDPYGLTPATFADVDAALREPGLAWGAAKAHVHLARRRIEGRR
ncbi:MAG: hypothetical protein ACR2LQ_08150 [Acidimicrobiales bacterium]